MPHGLDLAQTRVSSRNGICFSWLPNNSSCSVSKFFEQTPIWVGQLSLVCQYFFVGLWLDNFGRGYQQTILGVSNSTPVPPTSLATREFSMGIGPSKLKILAAMGNQNMNRQSTKDFGIGCPSVSVYSFTTFHFLQDPIHIPPFDMVNSIMRIHLHPFFTWQNRGVLLTKVWPADFPQTRGMGQGTRAESTCPPATLGKAGERDGFVHV